MTQTEIVDAWLGAMLAGKLEALAGLATRDLVLTWNGQPDLTPWSGTHTGVAAAVGCLGEMAKTLHVRMLDVLDRIEAPGVSVVTVNGRWTARATQVDLLAKSVMIFRFREGRVAAFEVWGDSAAFTLLVGRFKRL